MIACVGCMGSILRSARPVASRGGQGSINPLTMPLPPFQPGRFAAIAIGSSTGGPGVVQHILSGLPADLGLPIFVAQHMPPIFTASYSNTLAHASPLAVYHAEDGMPVVPGAVYVGRGHQHMRVVRRAGRVCLEISPEPTNLAFRPSVDELFRTVAEIYGGKTLAVVISGIGKDGLLGAKQVVERGGVVLTQTRATCAVYGMPRACDEAGLSSAQLDPEGIRQAILQLSPPHAELVAARRDAPSL